MTEKLEIGDKIFRLEPKLAPMFGYYEPYPFLKRLYCWLRGWPTREYVPGILDYRKAWQFEKNDKAAVEG